MIPAAWKGTQVRRFTMLQAAYPLVFGTALVMWFWSGLGYSGLDLARFGDHPGASGATLLSLLTFVALIGAFFRYRQHTEFNVGCCTLFPLMVASWGLLALSALLSVEAY